MRAVLGLGITIALASMGCASNEIGSGENPVSVVPPGTAGAPVAGMTGAAGIGAAGTGAQLPSPPTGAAGTTGAAGAIGTAGTTGTAGAMATAGTTGAAGAMATAGTGGAPSVGEGQPRIPAMPASCPDIRTGDIMVKGQRVQLWVGPAGMKGPMVFYWHGTGSSSTEATGGLGPGLQEVMSSGGVVASFSTTTGTGMNTGNNVWYTGDFEMADEIFACANAQGLIDPRQVYTAGCSAGGLQASAMVYGRSSYLAAAMPNSGGTIFPYTLEDAHVPAVMTAHGAPGTDVVIIDFSETSATQCMDIAAKGGFMVNCNHGGRHCGSPSDLKAAQWKFLKDHPFGVDPEPYAAGLPSTFPSYCQVCE